MPVNEPNTSPLNYANLWEIQLELGEIPDMMSNNLLEPCSPLYFARGESRSSFASSSKDYCLDRDVLEDEQEEYDVEEEDGVLMLHLGEVSCEIEPPMQTEDILPSMSFLDLMDILGAGVGQAEDGNGEEDEEEEDELERKDWNTAVIHPVYGMLRNPLEEQGGESRHDRKDSGVFVHSGGEGYIIEPMAVPEADQRPFPNAVGYKDAGREGVVYSAAYSSLQRIASSFS
ncbi:hypothetical protein BGZ54_003053 [Gamsiella multidivaricata]|nr:hypothetical protein BGZ54_003053 [Gamsiella multidivaricata]